MQTTKGFARRLAAGFMSIVMTLSLLPALSTPAEAAETSSSTPVYADEPNYWVPIGNDGDSKASLNTLAAFLRYQKGNPTANEKNECSTWLADVENWDHTFTDDTMYIKLESDITFKIKDGYTTLYDRTNSDGVNSMYYQTGGWTHNFPVYGNKVLDLNGHKIKVELTYQQVGAPLFKIMSGANLTIVDSQGGGKMIANSDLVDKYFDLFWVYSGGELVLNAPDAEFKSGYSKEEWLVNAYKNNESDKDNNNYNGYGRKMANGTAVTVRGGGKLTLAGGTVEGRGFSSISKYGSETWSGKDDYKPLERCAAIKALAQSTVHIIDGNVYGMGCADAMQINKDADITIESGVFDVKKVDRVILPNADEENGSDISAGNALIGTTLGFFGYTFGAFIGLGDRENYMDGSYGALGIPDGVFDALANDKGRAAEVLCGNKKVTGAAVADVCGYRNSYDHEGESVTIRPKSGSSTQDNDRVSITPTNGVYSCAPANMSDTDDGFMVNVSLNERYFSDRAVEFSQATYREQGDKIGHRPQEYYLNYKFTLYNENGKGKYLGEKSLPADMTSVTGFDLMRLTDESGSNNPFTLDDWQELEEGRYTVCCTITEVWKGEHTYKSAWYAHMPVEIREETNSLLTELQGQTFDLEISCNSGNYMDKVPTIFVELGRDTESALRAAYKKLKAQERPNSINVFWIPENGEWTDVTVRYRVYNYDPDGNVLIDSDNATPLEKGVLHAYTPGLKVVTAELSLPVYGGLNKKGAILGYDTIVISKNFLLLPHMSLWDGDSRGDYDLKFPNATLTGENQSAVIYLPGEMSEATTNKGTFDWSCDFLEGEHGMYMGDEADYKDYAGAIDDNGYLKLTLDGSYVVYCTYTPNKTGAKAVIFESVPIDVTSSNTQPFKVALAASGSDNTFTVNDIQNKKASLKLVCEGDLTGIEYVQFSLKGYPSEVGRSTPVVVNKADWYSNRACVIDLSQFDGIAEAIENGIDPCGEYTVRAVVGYTDPYKRKAYADDLKITIPKDADGYALVANGWTLGPGYSTAEEAQNAAIPLYLDSTNPNVTFSAKYYPDNATYDSKKGDAAEDEIFYAWMIESGNSISMGNEFSSETVNATIKKPGTTIIKMWTGISGKQSTWTTTYFKVCVPVTEIEFTQPDYQSKIGQYYRDVLPTVVAKATCGVSRTDAFDFSYTYDDENAWYETYYAPLFWNNKVSFGKDALEKQVAANDYGYVNYYFHLKDGQSYPLKKISESTTYGTTYLMDTSAVKLTIGGVTKTVEDWGIFPSESKNGINTGTSQKANAADFKLEQDVFVKDKSATYIDVVTIATTEPGVGDTINEKVKTYSSSSGYEHDESYATYGWGCKAVNVFSLSGVKTADGKPIIMPYYSWVSKATAETAGAPYTDAVDAKKDGQKSWEYGSSFLNSGYENGTYFNEVMLHTNENPAADGTQYYFSPDCTVILNGHLLDFAGVSYTDNYNEGKIVSQYSSLSLEYFYDVGDVNTVNYLSLTGIKPLQGNTPADCEDVTATGYTFNDGVANEAEVYLKQLTWFVDADNDGEYDDGEEVKVEWTYTTDEDGKKEITGYDAAKSTLWWDGTFLPGVQYSAAIEIGTDDSATRLAEAVEVSCDGKGVSLTGGKKTFVVTFDADNTIRTIHIATASGAAAANPANRDPLGVFSASNQGYKVGSYYVYKHIDSSDSMSSDKHISNFYDSTDLKDKTLDNGKYWMTMTFEPNSGYTMADKVKVLVNGSDEGEFGYSLEQVKDIYVAAQSRYVNAWRTFEVPATTSSGATVSGTVTSFGSATDDVIVQLIESGTSEAAYEATVTGNSAAYSIENVPAGTYTMKVMKKNHVTETVEITVSGTAVTQSVTLSLLGDVNGDNKVTAADLTMLARHVAKNAVITDSRSLRCADVTRDNNITASDLTKLARYVAKNISSFD